MTAEAGPDGKEVYSSNAQNQRIETVAAAVVRPTPVIEEEDDLNIPVSVGTACKHKGCGVAFVSDEVNRKGDGEGTVCTYHPSPVSVLYQSPGQFFISAI
jgi:hypothetical protein